MFSSEKSSSARNFNASGGTRVAQEPPQIRGFLVGERGVERRRCVRRYAVTLWLIFVKQSSAI